MATVHYGAILGESGFSRIVAIKRVRDDKRTRLHHASLIDEARLASRIGHPNVVATLDVVAEENGKLVVLEYVAGETLSALLRLCREQRRAVPPRVALAIVAGVLHGLHAAHEAHSVTGEPLGIVHRDVSPQNILVGSDGVARVLDFGIAKANERLSRTNAGEVKGKPAYLAPEQVRGESDRRTDVFAAGVVLWEALSGRRLFIAKEPHKLLEKVLEMVVPPPSVHAPPGPHGGVEPELDAVVLKALERDPARRYPSAAAFALALEERFGVATASQVARWVRDLAGDLVAERTRIVAEIERDAAQRSRSLPDSASTTVARARGRRERGDEVTEVDETASTAVAVPRAVLVETTTVRRPLASETPSPTEAPAELLEGREGRRLSGAASPHLLLGSPPAAAGRVWRRPSPGEAPGPPPNIGAPSRAAARGAPAPLAAARFGRGASQGPGLFRSGLEPTEAPPPKRRWALGVAVAACVAVAAIAWPRQTTALGEHTVAGSSLAKAATPVLVAPPPPPPPVVSAQPRVVTLPPPPQTVSAPPAPPASSSDPCKPPWRLKDGIRIPKPECL
jgi:tRNA A-37 threonylcarbamoyl transferase component Bud32